MPLERRREPFDHPDWLFELKYNGFRALAFVTGGGTKLVSRRGLEYRRFDALRSEIALEANADDAVLDGEIVKLAVNGRDVRKVPLHPVHGCPSAWLSAWLSNSLAGGSSAWSGVPTARRSDS